MDYNVNKKPESSESDETRSDKFYPQYGEGTKNIS